MTNNDQFFPSDVPKKLTVRDIKALREKLDQDIKASYSAQKTAYRRELAVVQEAQHGFNLKTYIATHDKICHCAFCGKSEHQVSMLISSMNESVLICDECIRQAMDLVD